MNNDAMVASSSSDISFSVFFSGSPLSLRVVLVCDVDYVSCSLIDRW